MGWLLDRLAKDSAAYRAMPAWAKPVITGGPVNTTMDDHPWNEIREQREETERDLCDRIERDIRQDISHGAGGPPEWDRAVRAGMRAALLIVQGHRPPQADADRDWCVGCPDHEACSQGACHLSGGPVHP